MKKKYKYSEHDALNFAKEASQSVVIRSYVNGCSNDERRPSTETEAQLVTNAIAAALFSIRSGYDEDSAKATAEFFITRCNNTDGVWDEHINTYDSVYIPINDFLRDISKSDCV